MEVYDIANMQHSKETGNDADGMALALEDLCDI